MKIFSLILFLFLSINLKAQNNIDASCGFVRENIDCKDYQLVLNEYENCLIDQKLKEKSKTELLVELSEKGITSQYVNSPKIFSASYICHQALLKLSSKDDLYNMINSNNSTLRYYGFLGIAENYQESVFVSLKKLIQDTRMVRAKFGCTLLEKTLADFCIDQVTKKYLYKDENFESEIYQLNIQEKKNLDRLVLNLNYDLDYRKKLEE